MSHHIMKHGGPSLRNYVYVPVNKQRIAQQPNIKKKSSKGNLFGFGDANKGHTGEEDHFHFTRAAFRYFGSDTAPISSGGETPQSWSR